MEGGGIYMELMKVSSIVGAYPNKFVLANAVERSGNGAVELASVVSVCDTKQEAFTRYEVLKIVGIKTFIIPTFDTEKSLQIRLSGEEYEVKPLLTPSENALIYRQYYGWD